MKKTLTAIVVLGAIAGAVAYKLKKENEEKKYLDHELDMLAGEDETEDEDEGDIGCNCETETGADIKPETNENPMTDEIDQNLKTQLEQQSDSVISQLADADDHLEEERPIQHFVDFKTEEDMEAFKHAVIEKGYVVTRGENPLQLSVLHIAPISRSELLVNVYYLANQAIKHNGIYQGWQSRKVL